MTEDQIERRAEREIDALDRRYLAGLLTREEYAAAMRAIDERAKRDLAS